MRRLFPNTSWKRILPVSAAALLALFVVSKPSPTDAATEPTRRMQEPRWDSAQTRAHSSGLLRSPATSRNGGIRTSPDVVADPTRRRWGRSQFSTSRSGQAAGHEHRRHRRFPSAAARCRPGSTRCPTRTRALNATEKDALIRGPRRRPSPPPPKGRRRLTEVGSPRLGRHRQSDARARSRVALCAGSLCSACSSLPLRPLGRDARLRSLRTAVRRRQAWSRCAAHAGRFSRTLADRSSTAAAQARVPVAGRRARHDGRDGFDVCSVGAPSRVLWAPGQPRRRR